MAKRTIAIILALVMVIGLLPILPASTTANAAGSGRSSYWNSESTNSGSEYALKAAPKLTAKSGAHMKRLSGSTRNGTAVAISTEIDNMMNGCYAVVLANGWDFADALAGGPLAYALGAPILLITGDEADEETYAEIERLGVSEVYILGGTSAVSADVDARLSNEGYEVYRVAGDNRFETAVLIARTAEAIYEECSSYAFFTYSHNYPDALSVSGIASASAAPILYIGADGVLDPATAAYVEECGFNTGFIIGGTGAISSAAEGSLEDAGVGYVQRIAGATRYETCLEIFYIDTEFYKGDTVCVSTGANFPDALAGGVLTACCSGPMLLVDPSEPLSEDQQDIISYFGNAYILGGKVAVPEAIENEIKALVSST